jgi:hypothetical protein
MRELECGSEKHKRPSKRTNPSTRGTNAGTVHGLASGIRPARTLLPLAAIQRDERPVLPILHPRDALPTARQLTKAEAVLKSRQHRSIVLERPQERSSARRAK